MKNLQNTKITIVEDDAKIALHLEKSLRGLGYTEVSEYHSAEELLKQVDEKIIPELVIVNINLGGKLNGIELVEEIKNKTGTPVIYITVNSNNVLLQRAKQTNPIAFIVDPFDESQVYAAMEISFHSFIKSNEIIKEQKKELDMNRMQIGELMETQNHLISATWRERDLKDQLKKNKVLIESQNKNILDSINYAKRIQHAILPDENHLREILPDSFLIYRPKDIVSGDFYFTEPINTDDGNELAVVVVADSTGHGVPGALISVLGMSLLKQYLMEEKLDSSATALDYLNEKLSILLRQQGNDDVKDGMDIVCCIFDKKTLKLSYAGAHNPLWIMKKITSLNPENIESSSFNNAESQKYDLVEIKADKQPIGYSDTRKPFTNHEIQLEPGDTIYIFSDGYVDQFGGPKGKKFKSRQLREILLSIQGCPMEIQKEKLIEAFKNWQGEHEQVDDVCFLGMKF